MVDGAIGSRVVVCGKKVSGRYRGRRNGTRSVGESARWLTDMPLTVYAEVIDTPVHVLALLPRSDC